MSWLNSRKLLAKITAKWPAKVLSVAAAIVLMLFHRMSTLETRFFSSQLQVITGELVPSNYYSRVVRVSVRGEANIVHTVLEEDIVTFLDISGFTTEGIYQVPVQIRRTGTALGAEPLEISVDPLEITLHLEQRVSRNIPLIPVFRGNIAGGYEMASQSLRPSGIVAEGPASIIGQIVRFETGIIDLEGRNEDFAVTVDIINPHPFIVIRGGVNTEFHGTVRHIVQVQEYSEDEIDEYEYRELYDYNEDAPSEAAPYLPYDFYYGLNTDD